MVCYDAVWYGMVLHAMVWYGRVWCDFLDHFRQKGQKHQNQTEYLEWIIEWFGLVNVLDVTNPRKCAVWG